MASKLDELLEMFIQKGMNIHEARRKVRILFTRKDPEVMKYAAPPPPPKDDPVVKPGKKQKSKDDD